MALRLFAVLLIEEDLRAKHEQLVATLPFCRLGP